VIAAGRLHRTELSTIPEFLHCRFGSPVLWNFAASIIILMYSIVMYSIVLTVLLLAMGITLKRLAGLNTSAVILIVGGEPLPVQDSHRALGEHPLLSAITAAVQSWSSDLLHVVGLYFALDIYKQAPREAGGEQSLAHQPVVDAAVRDDDHPHVPLHRELFRVDDQPARLSLLGRHDTHDVRPAVRGTVFARSHTRAGAWAGAVGGFTFAIIGFMFKRAGTIAFHGIYPGRVTSLLLIILVSSFTAAEDMPLNRGLFPVLRRDNELV
jgi:Na+/proline symporter